MAIESVFANEVFSFLSKEFPAHPSVSYKLADKQDGKTFTVVRFPYKEVCGVSVEQVLVGKSYRFTEPLEMEFGGWYFPSQNVLAAPPSFLYTEFFCREEEATFGNFAVRGLLDDVYAAIDAAVIGKVKEEYPTWQAIHKAFPNDYKMVENEHTRKSTFEGIVGGSDIREASMLYEIKHQVPSMEAYAWAVSKKMEIFDGFVEKILAEYHDEIVKQLWWEYTEAARREKVLSKLTPHEQVLFDIHKAVVGMEGEPKNLRVTFRVTKEDSPNSHLVGSTVEASVSYENMARMKSELDHYWLEGKVSKEVKDISAENILKISYRRDTVYEKK